MLDNTVVLWGNHMEDGSSHGAQKMPWIIAGKGQGYFKTGQGIPTPDREINGPLFEICRAMGVKQDVLQRRHHRQADARAARRA